MITKENYIRQWKAAAHEERVQLRNSVAVSKDWDDDWTDRGVSFFIGSIAEMLTKTILQDKVKNWGDNSDYIYQLTEPNLHEFQNTPDFVYQDGNLLEAKFTRMNLKNVYPNDDRYPLEDYFGLAPTYALPKALKDKAIKEGARYVVVLDNIKFVNDVNDDYYGDLTSYRYSNLIQFDLVDHSCKILAGSEKCYELINKILDK